MDGDGCTLLVKLLKMSEADHLTQPLYINTDNKGKSVEFGSVLELYHNNVTGESVQMCWVDPGMGLPVDDSCLNGEEFFVFNGSLTMDGEDYSARGWLRYPVGVSPSPKRTLLKAGTEGAQVYRKTAHLTEKAMAVEKMKTTDD